MGGRQSSQRSNKDVQRKSKKAATLCHQLREKYLTIALEGFPWLEHPVRIIKNDYVELTLNGRDKLGNMLGNITLADLFKGDENQKMPRILIEGPSGYGKTSIVAKLAYDWACNESYMGQFNCVLLLTLRNCKGDLERILSEAAGITIEEYRDYFMEFLQGKSSNILLLMDGFDEASSEIITTILPLIHNETYNNVTVVITAKPGAFTTIRGTESESDLSKVIDKCITIEDFSIPQLLELFRKFLPKEADPKQVVWFIKQSEIIPLELLRSPLLAHIFMVFIYPSLNSLTNQSDIYKLIFNVAFRRYFSKLGEPVVSTFDIFAVGEGEMSEPMNLMASFGRVALTTIKKDKDKIMHEELQQDADYQFTNLGFIKQVTEIVGITEEVTYVPVHKSILEFCSAYFLWISSINNSFSRSWIGTVTCFRPNRETASKSFSHKSSKKWKSERAALLYIMLIPYSSEYSFWFGSLGFSLLSTELTVKILASLCPLLPMEWRIPSFWKDKGFWQSPQHHAILSVGTKRGIIKHVTWAPSFAAIFPDNLEVDTFILAAVTPFALLDKSVMNGIKCQELRCTFKIYSIPTEKDTQILLEIIQAIQYQHICFNFSAGSTPEWLQCIHSTAVNGVLKDIKLMRCVLGEKQNDQVILLSELIRKEKLLGIDILVLLLKISPSLFSSLPSFENVSELIYTTSKEDVSQEQIDMIVACASKSRKLKRFSLVNQRICQNLTVDLTLLCDGGSKSWEWVQLQGLEVWCTTHTLDFPLQIQNLTVSNSRIDEATSVNMFCHCQVKSLTCESSLLGNNHQAWQIHEFITELRVVLVKTIYHHGSFFFIPHEMQHLQTLALIMESTTTTLHMPLERILLPYEKSMNLKGLEVWEIEVNPELAFELILQIVQCLEGRSVSTSSQEQATDSTINSVRLQVEYLMLHTQISPDPTPSTSQIELYTEPEKLEKKVAAFLSLTAVLKRPLMERTLPKLEIVCLGDLIYYMSRVHPNGVSSWSAAFPSDEGFSIKEEALGLHLDDHIHSKGKQDLTNSAPFRKFSITYNNPKARTL